MKRDPFELKIGKPLDVEWSAGKFLDFDQSTVDPRFGTEVLEEEKKSFNSRLIAGLVLLALALVAFRLVNLQITNHDKYLALAEGNRLRSQKLLAPRGLIYDRTGEVIARNKPSFELVFTPLDLPRDEQVLSAEIDKVANFFELDKQSIRTEIAAAGRESFFPVTLKQDVAKDQAITFLTDQESFQGFSIQNNPQRLYDAGPVFAHVTGYTGKLNSDEYAAYRDQGYLYNDIVGKNGLEVVYEKFLRGELGEKLVEVDAQGVVKNTFQQKDPQPGSDLHLYLDAELQKVLYDSLVRQMKARNAKKAAAVALDPKTGGVLALVSLPSFDDNWFARGITSAEYQSLNGDKNLPLYNRAIAGLYPPGSTVKPMLAAAALAEGVVKPTTKIFDGGAIVIPNQYNPAISYTFRGWKPGGLGAMDVHSAIAMSSDIYFYTIGGGQKDLKIDGLGAVRLADYMKKFYLGQMTGIDLPGEKAGLIPTPDWKEQYFADNAVEKLWFLGDTYNMSIGQGFVTVTPLQLTLATAAVANGGTIYKPQLAQSVVDRSGHTIKTFLPQVLASKIVDDRYLAESRQGMRDAVTSGTARTLASVPMSIAGKTGTSQFDGSDLSRTHAWFTSFAPYEDPKIVLTVLIEAGGEGSSASVPVAQDVYNWYSKNRQ
jgi:penicillin-binding protein 2